MATLYEIHAELQDKIARFNELIVQEDGRLLDAESGEVVEPNILELLQMDFDEKVKNCLYQVKNYEVDEALADAKVKFMEEALKKAKAEKQAITNHKDRFKAYIATYLGNSNWQAKDKSIKCSFRCNKSVEVTNIELVPSEYKRATAVFKANDTKVLDALKELSIEPKYEPMKAEALKALKAGEEINGFALKENYSMTVK